MSRHGGMTFQTYVDEKWLPHHVVEPTTKEGYRYSINRHLMPFVGPMKLVDVTAPRVREWVTWMVEKGVTPATIRHNRIILSAIFTTAVNDVVIPYHFAANRPRTRTCTGRGAPTPRKSRIACLADATLGALHSVSGTTRAQLGTDSVAGWSGRAQRAGPSLPAH